MTLEKEIYRRKQKPKTLRIYFYRFLPVVAIFIYAYFSSRNLREGANVQFILACIFIGIAILIMVLATSSVSDSVNVIIINNSEGTIELKYFKDRSRSESCEIKYIKYFYDCKKDEHGNPLEKIVSIEMPSGNYFKVREFRGFNGNDLEQIVKKIEYFNGRKFDS